MLVPVQCSCGRRFWLEFSIKAEEKMYLHSIDELREYLLKEINVLRIHEDDITQELREQFCKLIENGEDYRRALKIISEIYGIPALILEDILYDLIDHAKVFKRTT